VAKALAHLGELDTSQTRRAAGSLHPVIGRRNAHDTRTSRVSTAGAAAGRARTGRISWTQIFGARRVLSCMTSSEKSSGCHSRCSGAAPARSGASSCAPWLDRASARPERYTPGSRREPQTPRSRAWQILLATLSTCVLNPRVLSKMASCDAARTIC